MSTHGPLDAWLKRLAEREPGVWLDIPRIRQLMARWHQPEGWGLWQPPAGVSDAQIRDAMRELADEGVVETGTLFGHKFWRTR